MQAAAVEGYDVFLSHNSADKPAVEELARRLLDSGIRPWLDKWHLVPGRPWQTAIEEALERCLVVAVFIGPRGVSPWQNEEMRAAIDQRVRDTQGRMRVLPVLLPGAVRTDRSRLPAFLTTCTWVEFPETLDDEQAWRRLLCGIRGVEPGPEPGEIAVVVESPYRGLLCFEVEHAPFFFGREALVDWMTHELRNATGRADNTRFLGIVGPSGSGKSSLARAGLVAAFKRDALPESSSWPAVMCRTGSDPLSSVATALVEALSPLDQTAVRELIYEMRQSERALHLWVRFALSKKPQGCRLVLLLDQFEELFTHSQDAKDREALIGNLMHACTVTGGQTVVLLTLRADFYGECSAWPTLAAALSERQVLVGPMQAEQLKSLIERPAQMVGCEFEAGLVNVIIDDIRNQPGALPLLEYTLSELWNRRHGRRLTHAAYQSIGGVAGALESRAEQLYGEFTEAEQQVCRRIFLRLVQPTEDGKLARRRARLPELMLAKREDPELRTVVARLAGEQARLITVETGPGGVEFVDVAHEALIRNWERLQRWLEVDQEFQLWRKRLCTALGEWERANRHPDSLLRGVVLNEARQWMHERSRDLNCEEQEFLQASDSVDRLRREEAEARQSELEVEQQQRLESERRRAEIQTKAARRLRAFSAALAVLAALVAAAAVYAAGQARTAASRELAMAAVTVSETQPELSVLLALSAIAKSRTRESQEALHRAVQLARGPRFSGHDGSVSAISVSSDGKYLATAGKDKTARLWDFNTGSEMRIISRQQSELMDVAFSPDGEKLAIAAADGAVQIVRNALSAEILRSLPPQPNSVMSLAFSPDGRLLVTGCWDGLARVWAIDSGKESAVLAGHTGGVARVAISPDGNLAATASADGTAKVWDLRGRGNLQTLIGHQRAVTDVAFSRDGSRIATASLDGTVRLWNAKTGAALFSLAVDSSGVERLAFDPRGKLLATASLDAKVRLWDLDTQAETASFSGRETKLTDIEFQPGGAWLAAAGANGTVRLFELEPERLMESAKKLLAAESRTFTAEECEKYLHTKTCPGLP